MIKKHPCFNLAGCINCGICVQACPFSALTLSLEGKQGKYKNVFPEMNPEKCTGCGICSSSCPMDCIVMKEHDNES